MASPLVLRLTCMAVMCMVFGALVTEGALTCAQVQNAVMPCATYLTTGGGTTVPAACCSGIRSLNSAANTTPDRQTACRCLVSAVKSLPTVNPSVISGLPAKCGVNLSYEISPNIDCSKVN